MTKAFEIPRVRATAGAAGFAIGTRLGVAPLLMVRKPVGSERTHRAQRRPFHKDLDPGVLGKLRCMQDMGKGHPDPRHDSLLRVADASIDAQARDSPSPDPVAPEQGETLAE